MSFPTQTLPARSNITLELTDAIRKDWGGKPFVDMKKGWDYVLNKFPEIDQDRAVAAGASWGGYAIKYVSQSGDSNTIPLTKT